MVKVTNTGISPVTSSSSARSSFFDALAAFFSASLFKCATKAVEARRVFSDSRSEGVVSLRRVTLEDAIIAIFIIDSVAQLSTGLSNSRFNVGRGGQRTIGTIYRFRISVFREAWRSVEFITGRYTQLYRRLGLQEVKWDVQFEVGELSRPKFLIDIKLSNALVLTRIIFGIPSQLGHFFALLGNAKVLS